jgi:putative ABC transport system permease protein
MKGSSSLARDLRLSLRALGRARGFALAVVACIALGIGANGAVFTIVHATLIRPLPFPDPGRLVVIRSSFPDRDLPSAPLSEPELLDLRRQSSALAPVAGLLGWRFNLTGLAEPEQLAGAKVSVSFFPMLGARAALGRTFTAEEETPGRDRVVVLGHSLWRNRFRGDPGIVGRSLTLNSEPYTIVGVLPAGFHFGDEDFDLWAPLTVGGAPAPPRTARAALAVGRLSRGVSLAEAGAEMDVLARRLEREYPEVYPAGWGIRLTPLRDDLVQEARPALLALFAAGALVLLTACGNVVHLMLARATDRRRELAIRSALGAGPVALARPLATEATLLALSGCALGLLLAFWIVSALVALAPRGVPRLDEIAVDHAALPLALGLALAAGLGFGALATVWALDQRGMEALKDGGEGAGSSARSQRTRSLLVTVQVALALLVLIGAGLLTQSFLRARRVDPGFRPDHLLTFQIFLPRTGFSEPAKSVEFFAGLLGELRAIPGVRSAAAISDLPFSGSDMSGEVKAEGAAAARSGESYPTASWRVVTPGYFQTLGIPLERGRLFGVEDRAGAPGVVLVDSRLARRLWPAQDPVGKHLLLPDRPEAGWLTVVGVVGAVKHDALTAESREQLYLPHPQSSRRIMSVVVRSAADPAALAATVRDRVGQLAPDLPVTKLRTMDELIAATTASLLFNLWLFGGFSAVTVTLATLGLYSVTAHSVARRSREIALRMALGSSPAQVLQLVVRQGLLRLLPGLVLGLTLSFWITRLLRSQLFQVAPGDPVTFAAAALFIVGLGLLASYLPARKAARIEPQSVFRQG